MVMQKAYSTRTRMQVEFVQRLYDAASVAGLPVDTMSVIGRQIDVAVRLARATEAADLLDHAVSRGMESKRLPPLIKGVLAVLDEVQPLEAA